MTYEYYKLKYLKYKKKYLKLKNLIGGVPCPIPTQCNYNPVISFTDPNYASISKEQADLKNECINCYSSCCTICKGFDIKKCTLCRKNNSCHIYFNQRTKRFERTLTNILSAGLLN